MGSSSKATQPAGQTITQSALPAYFQPYVRDILKRGQAASYQPYTPYGDQRIAGFTPGQVQAQEGVLGLQTPGQFGAATRLATQAGRAGIGAGSYSPASFTTGSFTDPGMASQYMSPYMQNVLDVQKRGAITDAQKAQLGANLGAARQGTYGGARQLLAQTQREQALGQQLGDIQARGLQSAYESGMGLFGTEEARRLEAQKMAEQSRQYGAGLGLEGAGMGLRAAETLGGLGTAAQQAELQRLGAISGAGAEQQALTQRQMDLAYQDFLRQQQYPMSQLQQYAGLISGLPSPGSTQVQTSYSRPSSLAGQLLGTAGSLGSAYMLSQAAKGGEVKKYNVGGPVAFAAGGDANKDSAFKLEDDPKEILYATMGDPRKMQTLITNGSADPTAVTIAAMLGRRIRDAQMAAPAPEQTVVSNLLTPQPPQQGLGAVPAQQAPQPMREGLNAPEFTAADGGIVGYPDGGSVRYDYPVVESTLNRITRDIDRFTKNYRYGRNTTTPQYLKELRDRYARGEIGAADVQLALNKPFETGESPLLAIPRYFANRSITPSELRKREKKDRAQEIGSVDEESIPSASVRDEELDMELTTPPLPDVAPTSAQTEPTPGLPTPPSFGVYSPSEIERAKELEAPSMSVPTVRDPKDILKQLEELAPYDTTARDALIASMNSKTDPNKEFLKALVPGFARMAEAASEGKDFIGSLTAGAGRTAEESARLAAEGEEKKRKNLFDQFNIEQAENARRSDLRREALSAEGREQDAAREVQRFNEEQKAATTRFNIEQAADADRFNAEQRNAYYRDLNSENNANYRQERQIIATSSENKADREARIAELDKRHENDKALLELSADIDRAANLDQDNREYVRELLATDNIYGIMLQDIMLDEDIKDKGQEIKKVIDAAKKQAKMVMGNEMPRRVTSIKEIGK
jgi:hypothetical protein